MYFLNSCQQKVYNITKLGYIVNITNIVSTVSYASKYEQFDKTYGMPDIQVLISFGVIEKVYIYTKFLHMCTIFQGFG